MQANPLIKFIEKEKYLLDDVQDLISDIKKQAKIRNRLLKDCMKSEGFTKSCGKYKRNEEKYKSCKKTRKNCNKVEDYKKQKNYVRKLKRKLKREATKLSKTVV